MNLRMLLQAGPAKANDLFAKLAETSDGAVKTREKLFGELKDELERHASLEERFLYPVLRRSPETKELAVEAVKDNKNLRSQLADLEALPKNDEGFLRKLRDLQRGFRQHARDEKRELLPAVQRALSEEQLQNVAEKIEAEVTEAERAKHQESQAHRTTARQERELAKESAGTKALPVVRASENADRLLNEAAQAVRDTSVAAETNVVQIAEMISATSQREIAEATETVSMVADVTKRTVDTIADSRSTWIGCFNQATIAGTQMSQKIFWQAAERQQQFVAEALYGWIDRNVRIMQSAMSYAERGFSNFGGRRAGGADRGR